MIKFLTLFLVASLLKLNKNTYGVHAITRDGNCMFRAMSLIIWETESRHQQLRNEVSIYLLIKLILNFTQIINTSKRIGPNIITAFEY